MTDMLQYVYHNSVDHMYYTSIFYENGVVSQLQMYWWYHSLALGHMKQVYVTAV